MDKKILDNVFEPFFTTKELDRETGLGLSTVDGIIKQNHGFIELYSEIGKYTTFKIYILRYEGKEESGYKKAKEKMPQSSGETILIVTDEDSVLNQVRMI
ncbi:MAG: hypothetical protein SWO11_20755 [Thermodesulfobacteriota bacterium]|nr:hypothetical protein [Thermodesulfobacteriota bacterium]